jgi:membrane protein
MQPLVDFWFKLNDDWVFNLSGLLAYNFLMSLFPIVLILLAGVGFFFGGQAAGTLAAMKAAIERLVPGGGGVFDAVTAQLASGAGLLLVIGLATALFAGSRLFVVLENCFGVIYRVPSREFLRQNLMALGMLALYLTLVSVIILTWTVPSAILPLLEDVFRSATLHALTIFLSYLTAMIAAFVLLCAMYYVVPNRRMRAKQVWPGAVVATLLLALYELLFPTFVSLYLRPNNYGAVAAFAIVSLFFFYYVGFILLLGAELNAWIAGERRWSGDIAATMYARRRYHPSADASHDRP